MRTNSLFIFLLLFLGVGFHLISNQTYSSVIDNDATEEIEARKLWEQKMLADPNTGEIPLGIRTQELQFWESEILPYNSSYKKERGADWKHRGPWNVGGRTRAFAVDINNENHLIVGSVSGGIWQSMDAGSTWTKVSGPNDHPGIVSIAQDTRPGKTNLWYALSGELYGTSASGGSAFYLGDGAFKSLDNGNTWTPIASTAAGVPGTFSTSFQGGWKIACSPVDTVNTCIYMATYGSVFRSTDTGNTWKAVVGLNNNSYFTDVMVSSTGIVYAAFSTDGTNTKGMYRSADGINFTNITPSFLKSSDRIVIEINPNNENEVYFIAELPSDTSGGVTTTNYEGKEEYVGLFKYTYLSGDGSGAGGSWINLSQNLPVNAASPFDKFNCQGGYDLLIKVQPNSNDIIIGGTNLYRSTDGFTSLNHIAQIGGYGIGTTLPNFGVYPNHHPDQHGLLFLKSNPAHAYSFSDGGLRYTDNISTNDVVWQDKSLGYISSQAYSIAIDESKSFDQWALIGLQDNGNYISYSNNPKDSWKMTINGDGAYNYIAPNREYYIISTQLGNVRKVSMDTKGNVMKRKRIDPDGYDKSVYNFINVLTVDPTENHTLYMPIAKRVGRLNDVKNIVTDNNTNKLQSGWTISSDTITSNGSDAEITTLAFAKSDPNILYIGTSNRELYICKDAKKGNLSLEKLSISRLPSGGYVSGIAVDPDSAKNVLICYSNYKVTSLFYSNDTGKNWFLVGGNLEGGGNSSGSDPSVRCVNILVQPNGKRIYFAGTSIGLFSTDSLVLSVNNNLNKTVWQQEGVDNIGANIVTDIKVRNSDGYVVAATHGNGIFETYYTNANYPISNFVVNSTSIYPNPANSNFVYTFTTQDEIPVYAYLVDIMGRKVIDIINDTYRPGTFSVKINSENLPTGRYFVVYSDGKSSKTNLQSLIIAH